MAFAFPAPRHTPRALRNILLERMEKAITHLSAPIADRAEGIHEARKRFKEIRAVLRLVSDTETFPAGAMRQWFRDAGRELSGTRDAQALVECWDKLDAVDPKALQTRAGQALHRALIDNTHDHLHDADALDSIVRRLCAALNQHMTHLPEIDVPETGFDLICSGFERTYRAGRRQLDAVQNAPTAEHFHDWRKRVKDHWYHTRLIAGAWPVYLEQRQSLLKTLSDLLGDDHDLMLLRSQMLAWSDRLGSDAQQQRLLGTIGRRQAQLRQEALSLGRRIYAERPRSFTRRITDYWRLWEEEDAPRERRLPFHPDPAAPLS